MGWGIWLRTVWLDVVERKKGDIWRGDEMGVEGYIGTAS